MITRFCVFCLFYLFIYDVYYHALHSHYIADYVGGVTDRVVGMKPTEYRNDHAQLRIISFPFSSAIRFSISSVFFFVSQPTYFSVSLFSFFLFLVILKN